MVEYTTQLDSLFMSLADATRHDMLRLLNVYQKMSVGEIAAHYRLTFAAVSKHLIVLETAKLVRKKKKGKTVEVSLSTVGFKTADQYIKRYEQLWNDRLDRLDVLLNEKEE